QISRLVREAVHHFGAGLARAAGSERVRLCGRGRAPIRDVIAAKAGVHLEISGWAPAQGRGDIAVVEGSGFEPAQIWMAPSPSISAASRMASDRVGWAWVVRARSSEEPENSIRTVSSWIISPAFVPMIWAPRTRPVLTSERIFTKPCAARSA